MYNIYIMENEILLEKHTKKSWFKSALLGLFFGLAIIIPGVSGAQIAILFKMYDKMTYAVSKIFKKFKIAFFFLLPIIIGIVIGFAAGFFAIKELLPLATFALVAFFAGMMLGGTPVYVKEIKGSKITWVKILLLIVGLIVPIGISVIAVQTHLDLGAYLNEWWMFIVAVPIGFIVAVTQIIPGLSATSTLLSIGVFNPIVESVSLTYWKENPTIFVFYLALGIGFLGGLFILSKLVTKFIEKFKVHFYYLALGLSISSIVSMFYNPEVVEYYATANAPDSLLENLAISQHFLIEMSIGILLFFGGMVGIYLLFYFSNKKELQNKENA